MYSSCFSGAHHPPSPKTIAAARATARTEARIARLALSRAAWPMNVTELGEWTRSEVDAALTWLAEIERDASSTTPAPPRLDELFAPIGGARSALHK